MKTKLFLLTSCLLLQLSVYSQYVGEFFNKDGLRYKIINKNYYNSTTAPDNEVSIVKTSQIDKSIKDVILPEQVEYNGYYFHVIKIEDKAFEEQDWIESISIPKSITSMGYNIFLGCKSLSAIYCDAPYIVGGSQSWEAPFASVNRQIVSFELGEHVEKIRKYLCKSMSQLKSIVIPKNVYKIGEKAFESTGITKITWNAKKCDDSDWFDDKYGSITLNLAPFYSLRDQVTSFTFGEEVEEVPAGLLLDFSKVTSIILPKSVTRVRVNAFYGMKNLTEVTCEALQPPMIESAVFMSDNKNMTLYVPFESIDKYKESDWKKYFVKIMPIGGPYYFDVVVTPNIGGNVVGAGRYQYGDTATLVASPNKGYEFIQWSNGIKDNPYSFIIENDIMLSAEFSLSTDLDNVIYLEGLSTSKVVNQNGQLLIYCKGKTYTVTGQEVE